MTKNIIEDQIITINSQVNEIFAKTEVIQKYKNILESPLEIKIEFPILPSYSLTKFLITLDNKTIISKILEAEKGKEKYNDEIASGNTAFYGSIFESGEKMEINIGNLLPGKIIEVKAIYLQLINSEDMSYCFSLIQSYPKMILTNKGKNIIMKGIKCNIYLTTQSNLIRLILLNKRRDINYNTDIKNLAFAKINFNNNDKYGTDNKCKFLPYSPLKILFRTENMNIPMIYSQYNEEKNESSYFIRYMYSNIEIPSKFSEILNSGNIDALQNYDALNYIDTDINISYIDKYKKKFLENQKPYPGCYIFIIDQSGSMHGEKMEILKQTLILFLKSLPFGSYFQIIGFGTSFIKYNQTPVLYNQKNIEDMLNFIPKLDSNMVLTNMYFPLKEVFSQEKMINLPTNIILITDGKVFHSDDCINLIKENNDYGRVHCIGIGENYSKYFIETAAQVGKGLKFFITKYENLFYDFFSILNIYSQKFLQNLDIKILNYKEYFDTKIYNSFLNNYFITQNDIISYGFICPGKIFSLDKKESIKIKINENNDIKECKDIDIKEIESLNNGDELGKIIIGSLINNHNSLNKKYPENEIIKLSIKYEVLSKFTCFFGSFKNEEKNDKNGLINLNQFYLPEDRRPNVSYSKAKTGKHGHAKNVKIVLNEEEIKYNNLIVENFDNSENYNINIDSKEFKLIRKIIEEQNIEDGSWDKKYNFEEDYNEIYDNIVDHFIKQNILNKDVMEKICCTIFIIYTLKQKFYDFIHFWAQVVKKGIHFLINNKIDYDEIIGLISVSNNKSN